jgi:hypothetical protein
MEAVRLITDWVKTASALPGFEKGLIVGIVGFAGFAFVIFFVRWWWGEVTAPYRPQRVTHTTSQTPSDVSRRSCLALLVGLAVVVFLLNCATSGAVLRVLFGSLSAFVPDVGS